ncbi:MAG TPA: CsbD family protein [Acidimicrobiales bacterium]|nr:CsbD family protein [Acidimicrobiales bacterium]
MGTDDKLSNKAQDLKGKAKEAIGDATNNDDLEAKGKSDQAKASVKDVGEKVKDAVGDVKDAITRK